VCVAHVDIGVLLQRKKEKKKRKKEGKKERKKDVRAVLFVCTTMSGFHRCT